MKATFLLSKDPTSESTGDLTMAKLVIELARESYETAVICLSSAGSTGHQNGLRRVAKPILKPAAILAESVLSRRSLVHTRFVFPELVEAVDDAETDIFVADHSYMAEAVLRSARYGRAKASDTLAVSTVVPEALVWRATRGVVGKADAKRIVRDEIRVARSGYTVGTYDREEAEFYAGLGLPRTHWLDLTLPAGRRVDVRLTPRRLLFLGDRRWAPNQEAFLEAVELWPDIAKGVEGAELVVVGAADPNAKAPQLPDGVRDLGFVDDLAGLLSTCRAMFAPIRTGGGVRVKILNAASSGLPIVATTAAVGSLGPVLGIDRIDGRQGLIDRCRRYLLDSGLAAEQGDAMYETNAARWDSRRPHAAVQDWLRK